MFQSTAQAVQENGSWYLHLFLVKAGYPIDPMDEEYLNEVMVHKVTSKAYLI